MTAQHNRVVCRVNKHTGAPELFLPDVPTHQGFIAYVTANGEIGHAAPDYMRRSTRPAKGEECAELLARYKARPDAGRVVLRQRIR